MFRSQECLFGYDGLVIWYYSPRDELPRYPQSCEGWCELNDESSKESKSWENGELDDLNTTLTSQWTQTLTPNHISTPGILDPAWSGFWGGKKRERAVQDRPRFWTPGSSCFPIPLHCWLLSPTSISPTRDSPPFSWLTPSVKVSVNILSSVVFRDLKVPTMHHLTRIRRRSSNRPKGRTQKSFFRT